MTDVNVLLSQAVKETDLLNINEEFLVRDLFKGYKWNRIPLNNRLLLGRLFYNNIIQSNGSIVPVRKTSSGQQIYRRDK